MASTNSKWMIIGVALLASASARAQSPQRGELTISPAEVVAGSFQEITIAYRLENTQMSTGGGIRVEFPVAYGETESTFWSKPQTEYADVPGYVVAATSTAASIDVAAGGIAGGIATAQITSGTLRSGDSIAITYRGAVQSLAGDMGVRADVRFSSDGTWKRVDNHPNLRILPREPHTLIVTTPADVGAGTPFDVAVVLLDQFGNRASRYRGSIALVSTDSNGTLPSTYEFVESDQGIHVFRAVRFDNEGFQRVTADDPNASLQLSSNYSWVWPDEPPLHRFFGDTHFHTGSGTNHHGFIGASAAGDINTLATKDFQALNSGGDHRGNFTDATAAYQYARDVVRLDFASSSEHDAILFDSLAWDTSQAISEDFYSPGRFTTLFAYEWTSGTVHHIVLYPRRGAKVFERYKYPDLPSLWDALDSQGIPALTIPHVTWTFDDHPIWDDINNTYRRVGEIYSLWNSRFLIQPDDIPQRFEVGIDNRWSYQYAWHHGHRIGLVGATDNHLGRPGANNYTIYTHHTGGFATVLASENTRGGIWDALQNRRTYATTGTRIYLDFQADGHPMGSEYITANPPMLSARVAGTNRLASVEIVKYENGVYTTPYVASPAGDTAIFEFTDPDFKGDCFYYLRVKQVDEYPGRPWSHSTEEMAWSSPIWVATPGTDQ